MFLNSVSHLIALLTKGTSDGTTARGSACSEILGDAIRLDSLYAFSIFTPCLNRKDEYYPHVPLRTESGLNTWPVLVTHDETEEKSAMKEGIEHFIKALLPLITNSSETLVSYP